MNHHRLRIVSHARRKIWQRHKFQYLTQKARRKNVLRERPDAPQAHTNTRKTNPLVSPEVTREALILRYNSYGNSMISGRVGCELAVLAVVCILLIFLFPAMQGPYCVVHGPATALLAAQAAFRLRMAIVQAALSSLGNGLISSLLFLPCVLSWLSFSNAGLHSLRLSESSTILRC
jgi:hypothetical protein